MGVEAEDTERSAYGIVTDPAEAGYVIKEKDGRRSRYQIQAHLPLPDPHRPGTHHRRSPGPARGPGPARHRTAPARLTGTRSPSTGDCWRP
jgi:hypothetical protein